MPHGIVHISVKYLPTFIILSLAHFLDSWQ